MNKKKYPMWKASKPIVLKETSKIKRGEYFRAKKYKVLGSMLEEELETFFLAEELGASKGSAKDLLDYLQHEVRQLPQHIRQKILLKLQANAQSKASILQYIYNYILCCSGNRVIA